MSIGPDGIPIIGQQPRVIIADHRIVTPNSVEAIDNGLSMGDSIAHLRIMVPLKAECIMVPLVRGQVRALADQLLAIADEHDAQAE